MNDPAQAASHAIFFQLKYLKTKAFLAGASRVKIWRNGEVLDSFSVEGLEPALAALDRCHDSLIRQQARSIDPFAKPPQN